MSIQLITFRLISPSATAAAQNRPTHSPTFMEKMAQPRSNCAQSASARPRQDIHVGEWGVFVRVFSLELKDST
jgi:hypothetical protein